MRSAIIIFSFLSYLSALGQELMPVQDTRVAMEKFASRAGQYSTIRADFEQTREIRFLQEPAASSGVFYTSGQESYRWEQTDPESYILVIDKETVHSYSDGSWQSKNTDNVQYAFISKLLGSLVAGDLNDSRDFEISCVENQELLQVLMIPQKNRVRSFVASISCTVRKSDYLLERIVMKDSEGYATTITFTEQQSNVELADNLFKPVN